MSRSLQQSSGLTTRQLCRELDVPAATLFRWRRRRTRGLPLLESPGPKKLGPLPFEDLGREIACLSHGKSRTQGTGALSQRWRASISRRTLSRLVAQQRKSVQQQRKRQIKSVRWKEPNLAWAIDATEYGKDQCGRKLFLIASMDLASRYTFEPLATVDPDGQQVASHLGKLFRRHGPPLLLKRDNGSHFNNQWVDALLAQYGVIPLNSPVYYPPYNGGIEKGIRDLKETLHTCLPQPPQHWDPPAIAPFTRAAAHLRNSHPRRILGRHTPAEAYAHQARSRFTMRDRHKTFQWITSRTTGILRKNQSTDRRSVRAAWRLAAESWLRCQGLITIKINNHVLPH